MTDEFSSGECVHRQAGMHGEIRILQNDAYRWLCYGDDVMHSCMSRTEPEKLVLHYQDYMAAWQLFFSPLPPVSALLLGVGGGDSIRFLQHHYPQITIRAVDQDPAIMRLACEWFDLQPAAGKLELVVEEAGVFMSRHQQRYDLIMVDMLAGENMPACLSDDAFWAHCYQSLSEQGLLLVNGIFAGSDAFMLLMKQLQACFGRLPLCISVPDYKNVLLFVGRQVLSKELSLLEQRAESIAQMSQQDFSQALQSLRADNSEIN